MPLRKKLRPSQPSNAPTHPQMDRSISTAGSIDAGGASTPQASAPTTAAPTAHDAATKKPLVVRDGSEDAATAPATGSGSGSGVAFRGPHSQAGTPGGVGGEGGEPVAVASKAPSWLKISGKGARARAEANGGVPAWLTGRQRGSRLASAKVATRADVERVLALVGASADRGTKRHGAGKRAMVWGLLRAGVPASVFRTSMARDALASRWTRRLSPCDAVRRWTAAVLGRPMTMRSMVRAFRDYGLAPTTKGRGKGKG